MSLFRRNQHDGASGVVDEAERQLNGRVVDVFDLRSKRIPVWSLVSVLAHGTRGELKRIADMGPSMHAGSWTATLGHLASGMLAAAPDDAELAEIQRRALVPIELRLLGREVALPDRPTLLAAMVVDALVCTAPLR